MSLPKYQKYKESGAEWLGKVPAHWRVDRFKASVASCRNGIWGDEPTGDSDDIACVRVADFDRNRLVVKNAIPTLRRVTERERAGRLLTRGDLLLEKSGGGELQPVGQVVMYDLEPPAVCSNFVARMSLLPGMVSSYWRYVHAAAYSLGVTLGSINQTSGIQNLDQERYLNNRAPFPPFPEQRAIATFLERETGKIDSLIKEQEKLVDLLAEKRQAVISHAVTRGLNPDARMKDSGVSWLGKIPSHWALARLGWLTSAINDINHEMPQAVASGVPFLSAKDLDEYGNINFENDVKLISNEDFERLSQKIRPEKGDIVYTRYGTIGRAAVVRTDRKFLASYSCCVIRTRREDVVLDFLRDVLASDLILTESKARIRSMGQPDLGLGEIRRFPIPLPPVVEQEQIDKYLKEKVGEIDKLLEQSKRSIQLLSERRGALIAAAVTGQIDVRGATVVAAEEAALAA